MAIPSTIETEEERTLRKTAERYRINPDSVLPLPWILVKSALTDEDPTLAATLAAVIEVAPDRISGPQLWLVQGRLRTKGSEPLRLTELSIKHLLDPMAEVTSVVVHGVQVARLRDRAAAYLEIASQAVAGFVGTPKAKRKGRRVASAAKRTRKVGRRGHSEDFYRDIALEALELYDEGQGSRTVLADLEARHKSPRSTVRDWIRRARDLGFLAPARKGRSQWLPGPKLNRKEK